MERLIAAAVEILAEHHPIKSRLFVAANPEEPGQPPGAICKWHIDETPEHRRIVVRLHGDADSPRCGNFSHEVVRQGIYRVDNVSGRYQARDDKMPGERDAIVVDEQEMRWGLFEDHLAALLSVEKDIQN
jgi:hypothetical protein